MLRKLIAVCALPLSIAARAEQPAVIPVPELARILPGEWGGEFGLGYQATSGNTETHSLNARGQLNYFSDRWKNSFDASLVNSAETGASTAERYSLDEQLDYNFSPHYYAFGEVEYEKDLFGGIREHLSEAGGIGRHVLALPSHTLDLELGVGARQDTQQLTGARQNDAIALAAAMYRWQISTTSALEQALKVQTGASNTYVESQTDLKLSIVGNLAAVLSYSVKNNSGAPEGTKNLDTSMAVSLTYRFGAPPSSGKKSKRAYRRKT